MKNSKLIRHPPDGRRAKPGVPGDRGLRGPREPGDPGPAGGGHAPDAAPSHKPRVPMPGTRQAGPVDFQVPGQGRAPHADLGQLQTDHSDPQLLGCPPPQETDRGIRGPLEEVTRGGDRGHAPDAAITVRETLGETIVKLDKSVVGRSPGQRTCLDLSRLSQSQSQYTPSWLNINVGTFCEDVMKFDETSDIAETISSYNQYCWQGPGGTKTCPMLPTNLKEIRSVSRSLCQPSLVSVPHHHQRTFFQPSVNLTEIEASRR